MKLVSCPVCSKKYLIQGLANHIINSAEGESFRSLNVWLDYAKNKPEQVSPSVWLKNVSHLAYWRRNRKKSIKFKIP